MAKPSGTTRSVGSRSDGASRRTATNPLVANLPIKEQKTTESILNRISNTTDTSKLWDESQTVKSIFANGGVSFESSKVVVDAVNEKMGNIIREAANKNAENTITANKVIDYMRISNSKYTDIGKVAIEKTSQSNYAVYYNGYYTGLIVGKGFLSEDRLRRIKVLVK